MKFLASLYRCALALLLCVVVYGCVPPSQSPMEEEKEPHFIEGKHALIVMDYAGAIGEFEKAVEANPRNASAHFELALLYEKQDNGMEPDPAAAIYHYQQFLKLRPNANTADEVRGRITNCKQDLAKGLSLPSSPSVQHDLEQLIQENKRLQTEVDQWRAWYKVQQTNRPTAQVVAPAIQPTQTVQYVAPVVVRSNPPPQISNVAPRVYGGTPHVSPHSTSVRTTYIVQSRDTMASISRKFNVKLSSLAAANPGLDARKLHPGQLVNIP
jgi:LysM repeat protein